MRLIVTANSVNVATVITTCRVRNWRVLVTWRISVRDCCTVGSLPVPDQVELRKKACRGTDTTARMPRSGERRVGRGGGGVGGRGRVKNNGKRACGAVVLG